MKTLEEIITIQKKLKRENGKRYLTGDYGLIACKESILSEIRINKMWNEQGNTNKWNTSLFVLLEEYVKRANEDIFFNDRMVLACWELINGIE